MTVDELTQQTRAYMAISCPQLGDCLSLIEECIQSARQAFTDEFICSLDHRVWSKITLNYHQQFLQSACDITVGEMLAVLIRDSIQTNRMDFLIQGLAQERLYQQATNANKTKATDHRLHIVPDE